MFALVFLLVILPLEVAAQGAAAGGSLHTAQPQEHRASETVKFLAGAALGLGIHEGGHLVFDGLFDAKPRLEGVRFGPFPFFAIAHRPNVSPRREFTISSAGFWAQEGVNEALLTRGPALKTRHAPVRKGLFAFNVLNSVGYAFVAFAKAGPPERDTRGMASSSGVDERVIGAMVLAPALLDAYRYFRPDAKWAAWTSRAAKGVSVALVIRKR